MESNRLKNLGIKDLREKLNNKAKNSDGRKERQTFLHSSSDNSAEDEKGSPHFHKNGLNRHVESDYDSDDETINERHRILSGIIQKPFFNKEQCREIEDKIDEIVDNAERGRYKERTVDRAPLRTKYFFGEGYIYGKQMDEKGPGREKLFPVGEVDEIPTWINKLVLRPLVNAGIVERDFVDSVVINDYQPGGCIVSHIDPQHIFDRPIISVSFFSNCVLSFGCRFSFNPIRTTEPVASVPLNIGCVTVLSGYAANNVTHCIRPEDLVERRAVIILRRVCRDAPRLNAPSSSQKYLAHPVQKENRISQPRKRAKMPYFEHDDRGEDQSSEDEVRPKRSRKSRI